MRWFWRLRKEWSKGEQDAAAEAEKSRQNLESVRREVIAPLRTWQDQNHFATIIRDSLQLKNGHV